jgi:hypothetical protein
MMLTSGTPVFDLHKSTDDEGMFSMSGSSTGRSNAGRKGAAGLQLAVELSDIVIYCQAVKFKVLNSFVERVSSIVPGAFDSGSRVMCVIVLNIRVMMQHC